MGSRSEKKHDKSTKNRNSKETKKNKKDIKNDEQDKKTKKKGFWKRHPKFKIFVRVLIILIVLAVIVGGGIIAGLIFGDKWKINKEDLILSNINTTIYDKDGNEIASVSGDEKRRIVHINDIPQIVQDAFISIETNIQKQKELKKLS